MQHLHPQLTSLFRSFFAILACSFMWFVVAEFYGISVSLYTTTSWILIWNMKSMLVEVEIGNNHHASPLPWESCKTKQLGSRAFNGRKQLIQNGTEFDENIIVWDAWGFAKDVNAKLPANITERNTINGPSDPSLLTYSDINIRQHNEQHKSSHNLYLRIFKTLLLSATVLFILHMI